MHPTFTTGSNNLLINKNYYTIEQASSVYWKMAIGNAPWPIGVTMVGIHARTGREKIFSQQIAHVLNDETQRKFIQVCCCINSVKNSFVTNTLFISNLFT